MASIDGESLELEVKHKDNGSWHPCCVSLSSSDSKFGLIINFENSNEEDIISNREDALERLRFRSTPFQDGECSHIKEGDSVLAMYKDQFRSMFFDAVIEKLHRVRHSNRVFCRCTFEIKWLNADLKEETTTIPSNSIMRLSTKEIGSHPIFLSFLSALSPKDRVEVPSSFSLLEEENSEADLLQGILERQIEEISKLADGPMEFSADLLEVKRFKLDGGKQSKSALTSHVTSINNQNSFRRSSRSQSKKQNEGELKKKLEDDKPFLTPLAARAAFASLIHEHELPLKRQLSFARVGKEDQECLVQKDIKGHSFSVKHEQIKYAASSHGIKPCLSSPIQDGDDDRRTESRRTSRSSNQMGTPKNTKAKECLHMEKPLQATEDSGDENWSTIVNKSSDSRKVGKTSARSMTTRVTRSSVNKVQVLSDEVTEASFVASTRKTRLSMHKEIDASLDEAKQVSFVDNLTSPVNATRLTRSGNQERSNPGTDLEPRKINLIQDTNGISEESEGKQASSPTVIINLIDSTTAGNPSGLSITTRVTRSSVHKKHEASPHEVKSGSSSKKIISPNARLTRSRNQKEESNAGVDQEPKLSEDATPGQDENKKRSSMSSPVTDARNKRTRASHGATAITEHSGATDTNMEDGQNATGEKKKPERKKATSSQKPQLRSSSRLNSLPRTLSQKKT